MRIITISREFGSGGRELGKRLSDILGYDYYDREIITAVAKESGLDEHYVESILGDHGWQNIPIAYCRSLGSRFYTQEAINVELLIKQRDVIRKIADMGQNFIIVGRNADVILKELDPMRIFVCADREEKIKRIVRRASDFEDVSPNRIERMMNRIDHRRARVRQILTDSKWGNRSDYDVIINTTGWQIKELAAATAHFCTERFERTVQDK